MKVLELINLIKQWLQPVLHDAIPDPRPSLEKSLDYKYREDILLGRGPVNKRISKLPIKPYNQDSTSACGAFSASHARLLTQGESTYPPYWYRARSNYNGKGMYLRDVLKLAAFADSVPAPTEQPDKLTEGWVNNLIGIDLYNNLRKESYEYVQIKPYDAEAVFDSVSSGNPTVIGFYCTANEWDSEMVPKDSVTELTAPVRHFVVCLPNSNHFLDGHEWVSVVDSAPNKGHFLRHIRKDFLTKRMYLGGGFYYKKKTKMSKKITVPENRCEYGQRNSNVEALQRFLFELGLILKEHQTGYYGNITAKAVLDWQLKNISGGNVTELNRLKGRYWGPLSIQSAKNLYSK